jgi:hypothetical protein
MVIFSFLEIIDKFLPIKQSILFYFLQIISCDIFILFSYQFRALLSVNVFKTYFHIENGCANNFHLHRIKNVLFIFFLSTNKYLIPHSL